MDRELDLSHADNEVWLIKVPKYIAQKWDNAPCNMDLGTLRIKPSMGQKNHVSLSLTQPLLDMDPQVEIPREHILDVSVVTKQTLGVFSAATNSDVKEATESADVENEKLYMEGRITQKLECRPSANNCYMKLKLESIRKASEPSRKVQSLDKVVQNFKPIKDHAHNVSIRLNAIYIYMQCELFQYLHVYPIFRSSTVSVRKRRARNHVETGTLSWI